MQVHRADDQQLALSRNLKKRRISSFEERVKCFTVYANTLCAYSLVRGPDMLGYRFVIRGTQAGPRRPAPANREICINFNRGRCTRCSFRGCGGAHAYLRCPDKRSSPQTVHQHLTPLPPTAHTTSHVAAAHLTLHLLNHPSTHPAPLTPPYPHCPLFIPIPSPQPPPLSRFQSSLSSLAHTSGWTTSFRA